ncbi:MAG: tandem-95 repeat protein, partial [Verrucomicrobia bacterium]|nr:tandem-95 repeat protein [Verrucomicrobiota bacterium]
DGQTAVASVAVTVNAVNDIPELAADALPEVLGEGPEHLWLLEDGQTPVLNLKDAFGDQEGDTLVFTAVGLPTGMSIDPVSGIISGQLESSASEGGPQGDGVYQILITVDDGNGGTRTFAFEIVVGNPAPIANNDTYSVDEDGVLDLAAPGVMGNDTDPDGDGLKVDALLVDPAHGVGVIQEDGSLTYIPNADFNGQDILLYQISDSDGQTAVASVAVTVNAVNDIPELAADALPEVLGEGPSYQWLLEDGQTPILNLKDAFGDQEGDTLTYTAFGLPTGMSIDPVSGIISGQLQISASEKGSLGDGVYEVILTVDDGKGGTRTFVFEIIVSNPPPVANNDSYSVDEESVLFVSAPGILFNDLDPEGDNFTISRVIQNPQNGALSLDEDGSFNYTPRSDFHGMDSFTYEIVDSDGGVSSATVEVQVIDLADPPVALDDNYVLGEDAGETLFEVQSNDIDPDSTDLRPVVVQNPSNGIVRVDDSNRLFYTPFDDFSGADSFTYSIEDELAQISNTASVSIQVLAGPKNELQNAEIPTVIFQSLDGIETVLTFSEENDPPNAISVSDPDSEELTVSMSVENGIISVNEHPELQYTEGIFEKSRSIQMFGRIEDLNEALAQLTYIPDINYLGKEKMVILTEDEGGPGSLPPRFDEDGDGVTILVELRALAGLRSTDVRSLLSNFGVEVVNVDLLEFDDGIIAGVDISNEPGEGLQVSFDPLPGQSGESQPTEIQLEVTYADGTSEVLNIPVTVFQPELVIVEELDPTLYLSNNLNPQTGFFEQVLKIVNNTPFDFKSIRIYIHDLTPDVVAKFYLQEDLIGTFVEFPVDMIKGDSTTITLEYFSTTGRAISPPRLELLVKKGAELLAPDQDQISEVIESSCFVSVGANGRVDSCYVSFRSDKDHLYWIEYSDEIGKWKLALNPVEGTGEMIIWQDAGSPKTDPLPADNGAGRYYRILKERIESDE